jgi:hypothetical protein
MGEPFAHITRCLELQEQDVTEALRSRGETKALLAHLAAISAPNTGAAKALIVLSRMATTACDWIDGDLSIDVYGNPDGAVIEIGTELGGGLRERLFAPLSFRAPIQEFTRAIERVPHMIQPLVIRAKSARRISLSATEALRRTTAPPPPIAISSESLFVHATSPAVPKEANAGTPEAGSSPSDDVDTGWDD